MNGMKTFYSKNNFFLRDVVPTGLYERDENLNKSSYILNLDRVVPTGLYERDENKQFSQIILFFYIRCTDRTL